ncbi:uncharacterized protein MYCFIDRAFT_86742 [Pseudocercospora fijiensis CIRAD86]|uniref:RING-type domain-containing protein n=1 Tax=Pseudocercospora fijiensis (strain CIRAD86) TaxID=383855 RepID=M2YQL3_PSEFD|nr:uncharacterized protein MYCFIDRAFT_86742 [Pseudocercospora fijiensis CIRAD86]EME80025.1 hypothetical protein MYCFIDRAFT_86742 [Pseudocercospora fijiensis CIRAD86]
MALRSKDDFLAQLQPACGAEIAIAPDQQCPVCHEPIVEPTSTSCGHVFCFKCLKQWLATSHTCPSCRHELYQKPGADGEENESEHALPTLVDRMLARVVFDFPYDGAAVRDIIDRSPDHVCIAHAMLVCSLLSQNSFVNYDTLLAAAVAAILTTLRQPGILTVAVSDPEIREGWKSIASAIESVLSRLSQQTLPGSHLFLAMEKEVQRVLRAPNNESLFARRGSSSPNDTLPYAWLELSFTAVLRQVVQASYQANAEQVAPPQYRQPEELSAFTAPPYMVHPQDLLRAIRSLRPQMDWMERVRPSMTGDEQVYVSQTLLMPPLLASFKCMGAALSDSFCQGTTNLPLGRRYKIALEILQQSAAKTLLKLNGETVRCGDLYESIGNKFSLSLGDWPEQDRNEAGFEEDLPKILAEFKEGELLLLLMPCYLVGIRLHDETQLPRVNAAPNGNAPATTAESNGP